jgi:hypothetical protein
MLNNTIKYESCLKKETGSNCLEFINKAFEHIRCKFYDKVTYFMECSNLTS